MLEKLPGELRENLFYYRPKESAASARSGKIKVTVEIDGLRKEFESELNAPPAPAGLSANKGFSIGIFEDALKKHGDELPPEVKRSLEAATKAMVKIHTHRTDAGSQTGTGIPTVGSPDIGAKLDMILERLSAWKRKSRR